MESKVKNQKWDEERFLRERKEVLSMWPTGKEVDFEEAVEYHKSLPEHKQFGRVMQKLHIEGRTVVFPRAGTPILEQEIELNQTLVEAGLPIIPLTPDSYCRLGNYAMAQKGLEESNRTGKPKLNGYPTVIHGVNNTRKVVESAQAALNQRLTNVGGIRLMAEIAFAAGITAALADPFVTFSVYEKKTTAAECIEHYQYIHRLVGYYAERGVTISVDIDGMGSGCQFPPAICAVANILCALLAAEQGVRSVMIRSLLHGYMAQDIASAWVHRRLVREYLDRFGFKDVMIPGLFLDMAPLYPYPQDMGQSFGFLSYSAVVAALAGAEGVALRTIDEAAGIPTKEAHSVSFKAAKWIFDVVRPQEFDLTDNSEIKTEEQMMELEVRAIVDRIAEIGDGDVAVGFDKAVGMGIIDAALSSNINFKGDVLGIRDNRGGCRYLDFGNLPLPDEVKEFHRQKVREREQAEGRKMDLRVVIEDMWAFSKGKIKGEPRQK
jgi:methylaspartate mutase epsilon subunit